MKLWPIGLAAAGAVAGLWSGPSTPQIVILSGDTNGNLAPCGCTKPMTGGIKRRVEAAHELSLPGHTTLLDNGNLVDGNSRQDELKAQTAAEILGKAGWNAINVGPADARLGLGMLLSLNSLSGGKLVASELSPNPEGGEIQPYVVSPPFLVIGVTANPSLIGNAVAQAANSVEAAVSDGLQQASEAKLVPVLLLQGDVKEARSLAKQFPGLGLIEYRSIGSPGGQIEREGNTVLASPGSDGKYLVRLEYSGGQFRNYSAIALGPQYGDDPTASRIYRGYLSRVSDEHLLEKMLRPDTTQFDGSNACGKCHEKALAVWKTSLHYRALGTLQGRGHDRDPECLPCHTVGLTSIHGFTSPKRTPDLASVGCESCHGAGLDHAHNPLKFRLPRVAPSTCANCHTTNTSPDFLFSTFWQKVRH